MARRPTKLAASFALALAARAEQLKPKAPIGADAAVYRDDPVGYCRDRLGIDPWSFQRELMLAVLEHDRLSIRSGHKCGKSTALACLALWIYETRQNARVVITAPGDRQVNGIIWREIKRLAKKARIAVPGADQDVKRASTGWSHPTNESEIRGYTAGQKEAIAGVSGSTVVYLVDEASGVKPEIFEAIEGNRADLLAALAQRFPGITRVQVRAPERATPAPIKRMTTEGVMAERLTSLRKRDPVLDAAVDKLDLDLVE
jgi:hypothetical protein